LLLYPIEFPENKLGERETLGAGESALGASAAASMDGMEIVVAAVPARGRLLPCAEKLDPVRARW
jgi:hypothetical protein